MISRNKLKTPRSSVIVLTCEHASSHIPKSYRALLSSKVFSHNLINSHLSWDEGALPAAAKISTLLQSPLIKGNVSRLLVDLNRSLHHPKIFSRLANEISPKHRAEILAEFYFPFRNSALALMKGIKSKGQAIRHFSIHSFVPRLGGITRNCEIGLLYDPSRPSEVRVAKALKKEIQLRFNDRKIRVRMNYPYRGNSDGHTTNLRKVFNDQAYSGIEIELNQAWIKSWASLKEARLNHMLISQCIHWAVEQS